MIRIDSFPANLHLRSTGTWKRFTRKDLEKFGKLINAFQSIARNFTSPGKTNDETYNRWLWLCNEKMNILTNSISNQNANSSNLNESHISAIVQNSSIPITSRLWLQLMDIVAEIEIDETKYWDFPHSASELAFS